MSKKEKRFDHLNETLVATILLALEESYEKDNLDLFTVVSYFSSKFETKELLSHFEEQYSEEEKIYPIYNTILKEMLDNIEKGSNKYRKFRRIIEKLAEMVDEAQTEYDIKKPFVVLYLDSFLLFTLRGREVLDETIQNNPMLAHTFELTTKAFVCLFYLAGIKGVTRYRSHVELLTATAMRSLLISRRDKTPSTVIEDIFDVLQDGFY